MRIIGGVARGTVLETPESREVRPTLGRAREALFDSLGDFGGASALDLFAGSGAFALEAASRGAARAVMVENAPRQCKCILRNIEKVRRSGISGELALKSMDVFRGGDFGGGFDVVFADPPYASSLDSFRRLFSSRRFVSGNPAALVVWEIPDGRGRSGEFVLAAKEFAEKNPGAEYNLRKLGGTEFLFVILPEKEEIAGASGEGAKP